MKNEAKEHKGRFLSMLLGRRVIRAGEGIIRALFNTAHPFEIHNFEIQKYYRNEPKCNGVYPKNNLSSIEDGAYIINLDEHESIGTHWIALYVHAKNVI